MDILHPQTLEEAVSMKAANPGSFYLGGGTQLLSIMGEIGDDAVLIDISGVVADNIVKSGDRILIGGRVTLDDIATSPLVPSFIRESAMFSASLPLRSQATAGGNVALSRYDSYLIPSLYAAGAAISVISTGGRRALPVDEYVSGADRDFVITGISIPSGVQGTVRRFGRSSHSHAAVIAAFSGSRCAYGVSGSGFAFGGKDSWKDIQYRDDLTGSADYKRYLASIAAEEA